MIRFGTEYFRADNKVYALGMTFSQVVSVYILIGSALAALIREVALRRPMRQEEKPIEQPLEAIR